MIKEPPAKRLPGEDGVWAFVLGDMVMFTMFFATFLFYRVEQGELFSQSQALLNRSGCHISDPCFRLRRWFCCYKILRVRRKS